MSCFPKSLSWLVIVVMLANPYSSWAAEMPSPQPAMEIQKVDIERGASIPPLDYLASILASPIKLLLWNRHYGTHKISPETEKALEEFIQENKLYKVKVRINQCAPFQEVGRIIRNKEVGLPYRIFAIPFSFITSATGRLLAGLIFSDYYDPFSNTINVYSNDISILLHEGGHSKDFEKQRWKGTYAFVRSFPGVDLTQELIATHEAFDYLEFHGNDAERIRAPKVLYPAFATYAGGYLTIVPFAWVGALLGGHVYGRIQSRYIREQIELEHRYKEGKRASHNIDAANERDKIETAKP